MNKKGIVIFVSIILIIIVGVVGYLLLSSSSQQAEDVSKMVNQGVLPSLGESTNPMNNKPDINPVDASNPFRSIKTNPFE